MKSRLFTTIFDDSEAENAKTFARHLADLMSLKPDARTVCLETYEELRLKRTRSQRKPVLEALIPKCKADRHVVEHAILIIDFFVDALLTDELPDTDPTIWFDDLLFAGWIKTDAKSEFDRMIEYLRTTVTPQLKPVLTRRRAAGGVLPVLTGGGFTTEIRSVRKEYYRFGTPAREYQPEVVDVTPVISIQLAVDEGNPSDFFFQAEEDDLDFLIDLLQAAKKDLTALKAYLKLDDKTDG